MLSFWNKIHQELLADRYLFLACVVGHRKGSPGTVRSQLLYTQSGEQLGTIGGGAMEVRMIQEAESVLRTGKLEPTLETLVHQLTDDDTASGLVCGGSQTLIKLVLDSRYLSIVESVLEKLQNDQPGSLNISKHGLEMIEEDLKKPSVSLNYVDDDWRVEFGLLNRRRVLIVGCGHCGAALAKQMDLLGFQISVDEPREDLYTIQELPGAVVRRSVEFKKAGEGIEHARLTFAVVMTPSYPDDVDTLSNLLTFPFPYIGVMGSPAKLKKIKEALMDRGFSESDWSRVVAPAGMPIESDTPEEIAVSVAAQILEKANTVAL